MIKRLNDTELESMRLRLLHIIEPPIKAAGIPVERRRPGLRLLLNGIDMRIWVGYYGDQRWWRLTCGYGSDLLGFEQSISRTHELTMLAGEIDEDTGAHLVALLREPKTYRWPLFTWNNTYPGYAWSQAGWDAYQADLRARRELAERRAAKGGR